MTAYMVAHKFSALPPGTANPGQIGTFEGSGGRSLYYRILGSARARHHLLYLHGIESHGAWFLPAATRLLEEFGCTTYLLDRRGSGLNMSPSPGDVSSARVLLEDVQQFRRTLGHPLHLVGLSWGGKLAAAVAIDQPDGLRSLTLITPGLRYRTDLPLLVKAGVFLSLLAGGRNHFKIPIEPEMFTHTPRFLDFIRNDPWRLHEVTARFLIGSLILDWMVARKVDELRQPILLFLAGHDPIIDNRGVLDLLSAVKSQVRLQLFDNAIHAIQFDQMEFMVHRIGAFLQEVEGQC
jgi:acylglycerol lipase